MRDRLAKAGPVVTGQIKFGARLSLATAMLVVTVSAAAAQGWWPWATPSAPPRPREPVYRGPPPAPIPQPNAPAPNGGYGGSRAQGGSSSNICLQLEQRLVAETQKGSQGRSELPRLEEDMRQTQRAQSQAQTQLDRGECFEQFLFVKSLRQTRSCLAAADQLETSKRRLGELNIQRQQMLGGGERSFQDEIIRELARNGCGSQYTQEARRRDSASSPFGSGGWQGEDDGPRNENKFGNLPFATYRTVCVRLCDGFFFPVSFSTLQNHFARDADLCSSRCAAPADLYYYQNPGADMRQAMSARNQTPYTGLKTAFKYTKELVPGCSCKQAEYDAALTGDKKADAANPGATPIAGAAPVAAAPRDVRTPVR